MDETPENVLRISHLREDLGFACLQVARTGEPIIVQRYNRQDVILVPLVEWRFLKQVAADLMAAENVPSPEPDESIAGTSHVDLRDVTGAKPS